MRPSSYSITPRISRREMHAQKFMDRRLYLRTAKERFSKLDEDYFSRKVSEERFPLDGNTRLAKAIVGVISTRKISGKLTILDIGAAGGAMTTLCLLKELFEQGTRNIEVVLLDISMAALLTTKKWRFSLPFELLQKEYGWSKEFVAFARRIIGNSRIIELDIIELNGLSIAPVDICVSGFTHHHMNIFDKEIVVRKMEITTKKGGIIGIVDESLSHAEYVDWIKKHQHERNSRGETVPIAVESFITLKEHIAMLRESTVLAREEERQWYCFVAEKNI